jgi:hypothetical protein
VTDVNAGTTPETKDVAISLRNSGWSPLPLPARAKSQPPSGYTGYSGKYASMAEVVAWDWSGNIAIRLPPDVVGVDVDVYHGGDVGLSKLEEAHGKLPETVWSTSREDGSGIALFRVPNGTTLATDPANGIDMIQAHHRYMVVWPSIHPEGRIYQWIDEASGEHLDGPPEPVELPDLPWGWVTGLAVTKTNAAAAATPEQVRKFIDANVAETFPQALKGIRERLDKYEGSRHDTLVEVSCWALREAAAGYFTARDAIDTITTWWERVMDDTTRRDGGELGSAFMWAVAQVNAEPERIEAMREERRQHEAERNQTPTPPPDVDPETGEAIRDHRNLPDDFWNARPVLQQIRQAAHNRLVSADAVLLCVLSRVVLLTPSSTVLPAIVGTPASLNIFGGLVGPSGGGKSTSAGVARELLPSTRTDVLTEVGPGSGEGLIEAFLEMRQEEIDGAKRTVKRQARHAVEVWVDEGQSLLAQSERSGATIMPIIRSAWNGETLTTQNASAETFRRIEKHQYRLCILLGLQPAYTADLIADAEGGTPQRFIFSMSTDPSLTGEMVDWPGEIEWSTPSAIRQGERLVPSPLVVATDVAREVRERALAVRQQRLELDPLDAHCDLAKLKLAAALALLDERSNVNVDDWELAGIIWRTSRSVRTWVIELADHNRRQQANARTAAEITKTITIAEESELKALESGARSIARKVATMSTAATRGDIARAPSGRARKAAGLDDMVAKAIAEGWIEQTEQGWVQGPKWGRHAA